MSGKDCLDIVLASPLGPVRVVATAGGVVRLDIGGAQEAMPARSLAESAHPGAHHLRCAEEQLAEYFSGRRTEFELSCDLSALTPFVREVLDELCRVPFGTTISYGELAIRVGRPRAARAVGRAMATNPVPLIVPCHRVIGKGGGLTGYSGGCGISTKEWLLEHETRGRHGSVTEKACGNEKGA